MDFQIIPSAEASVTTLMRSIDKVILNPIIVLLFALAVVFFIYGLASYLLSPDNEEKRKTSKDHMMWGIFGMFIMVSVFGIMRLLLKTTGEKDIKIDSNGSYEIGNIK